MAKYLITYQLLNSQANGQTITKVIECEKLTQAVITDFIEGKSSFIKVHSSQNVAIIYIYKLEG